MDSQLLLQMLRNLHDERKNVNSILIVRRGYLVLEAYFGPYTAATKHDLFSATKSITATLVSIAMQDQNIAGLSQNISDLLPEEQVQNLNPRKRQITLKDLLAMASGLRWNETSIAYSSASNPVSQMQRSQNWIRYVLDQPMVAQPGTQFSYHSGLSHLLSAIIQHRTGKPTATYAEERLFCPLGISQYYWPTDPNGIHTGNSGLQLCPVDMAKIGYLYLQDGIWNGERILPPGWVEASIQSQQRAITANSLQLRTWNLLTRLFQLKSPQVPAMDYGLHWWLPAFGGYAARGWAGQGIFVMPGLDLIAVFSGGLRGADNFLPDKLMTNYILPAAQIRETRYSGDATADPVRWTPEPLSPLAAQAVPAVSTVASKISGRRYKPKSAKSKLRSFALTFLSDVEAVLQIAQDGFDSAVKVGLDSAFRTTKIDERETVALRGFWSDETTFVLDWRQLSTGDRVDIVLKFTENQVEMRSRSTLTGWVGRLKVEWDTTVSDCHEVEGDDGATGSDRV